MGAVLYDGPTQRASMVVTDLERHGDGTAQVTLAGDLIRLWDRICFPDPANQFYAQTRDHDVRTGPAETVLLGFVGANAGPAAITARQVTRLRLPGNQARGPPPPCPRAWTSSGSSSPASPSPRPCARRSSTPPRCSRPGGWT
jgi:hypothetical protein